MNAGRAFLLSESPKQFTNAALAFAEQHAHTGMLVALWLDAETAPQLAVPGGEPADNLHVTLCYVPDATDWDELTQARAIAAVDRATQWHPALTGRVSGYGRFVASETSDAMDVFYASVDMPRLNDFRESVTMQLRDVGIQPSDVHGFTPHITLSYLAPDAKNPVDRLPDLDLTFNAATVVIGERRIDIPTSPAPVALYAVRDDGVRPVLHTYQPVVFAEPPEWAPFLPIPGTYHHPIYGQLDYTPDYYETLMANFKTGVYQDRLPVNAEHDQHSSGAVGWITDMRLAESGAIEVKVEWNERGRSLIEADRYKYVSAEVYPGWADPIDPDQTYDVAIGMAICTQPYFKQSVLPPLVASEAVLSRTAGNPGKENAAMAEETQATVPETPATGTPTDVQQATDQIIAQLSEKLDGKKISDPAVNEFVERAARELAQARANELKATENATKLSEQNAVLRAQNRVKYFTDEVTGRSDSNGTPWVGDVSDHVKMACSLTEKFGENSWELQHYIRSNRSNAEQARMSSLFTDIGSGKPADGGLTAYDQISMLATERAKASGETFAVAFDATLMSEHDLRAKYARESRQG